jgi:hypothetical protein
MHCEKMQFIALDLAVYIVTTGMYGFLVLSLIVTIRL